MSAIRTGLRQGSDAWLAARRSMVTATDVGAILGVSPWKSEADVADEKLTGWTEESNLPMRIGTALEPLIAAEYTRETGRQVQRMRDLVRHPSVEWAAASPDRRVVGERRLVELKWTTSRSRYAEGLPQENESQVRWSLGVLGWKRADVAVLVGGDALEVFEVEHDDELFEDMLEIARDFRARLVSGGPFSESVDSLRRRYPADDGSELVADAEIAEAVRAIVDVKGRIKALEADQERLEVLVKTRMGEAAVLSGPGFRVTWKRTKDIKTTDWASLADGLLRQLPDPEREALLGIATTTAPGYRPFRIWPQKEMDA